MKKENDEITDLFRTRLADAGMAVRDGFWEELSQDIPVGGIYQNRGGKQRKNGWRWGTCQSIADGNGTCIAETGT